MKKLAWLTDIHLDFLKLEQIQEFCYKALESNPDAFVISGDLSIATALHTHLRILEHYWSRPIYFVLGNHDYYRGSIDGVRAALPPFLIKYPNLKWLPNEGVVKLSPTTALIGHGLYADGRVGAGVASKIILNDYALIEELTGHEQLHLFEILRELGEKAAAEFEPVLRNALAHYEKVIAVTHAPPFVESAWFHHVLANDQFLPHLVCFAVGEMMRRVMGENPEKHLTVLCGHTHGRGEREITGNIFVKTGGARYRHPKIQEIISID
jgi:3',5'-cyclic-AMP phosphodiesterase